MVAKIKKFFKIEFIFFIVLAFFSSTHFSAIGAQPTKQVIWDNMSDEVDHWTDGIGYPIDKEIKEIVIALNLVGIKTIASCEGHFDHGNLYPWVDLEVSSPETEKLMAEIRQNLEQTE